jgi:acyl dehydratase
MDLKEQAMRFEQLVPGLVIQLGPREITEQEILEFARRYDPQYFHTDPVRAAASRWNGLIASGWMTASIAMQLVVPAILEGSGSIGSPGLEKLEWLHPVRPGDALQLRVSVLESRISKSGIGVVRWEWRMSNQKNIDVLCLVATSLFEVKQSA